MPLLLTLQYLGTRYAGWQTQANAIGVQHLKFILRSEATKDHWRRSDDPCHAPERWRTSGRATGDRWPGPG